jgi:hypothetical protein
MRLLPSVLALILLFSRLAWGDLLNALVAIEEKNYATAIEELRPLAQAGQPQSQFLLGKLLLEGRGGQPAIEEGMALVMKAAEQNYGAAQAMLGFIYAHGIGVAPDAKLAEEWLTRSLERLGKGQTRTTAEATLAALKGSASASPLEGPAPESAPVPEVAAQPIAPISNTPENAPPHADISAREPDAGEIGPVAEPSAEAQSSSDVGSIIGPASTDAQMETEDEMASRAELDIESAPPVLDSAEVAPTTVEPANPSDALPQPGVSEANTEAPAPTAANTIEAAAKAQENRIEKNSSATAEAATTSTPVAKPLPPLPQAQLAPAEAASVASPDNAADTAARPPEPASDAPGAASGNSNADVAPSAAVKADEEKIVLASLADIAPRLAPLPHEAAPEIEPAPVDAGIPPQAHSAPKSNAAPEAPADEVGPQQDSKEAQADNKEPAVARELGIRIQLAAVPDHSLAESEWKRIVGRNKELLAGYKPIFKTIDLGEMGVFHRVQTGPFKSLEDARSLCAKLIESGQDCLVMGRPAAP